MFCAYSFALHIRHFSGWPDVDELPFKYLSLEHIGISLLRNVPLEMHPFQTFHIIQMKARIHTLLGRQSIIYVPNQSAIMFVASRALS